MYFSVCLCFFNFFLNYFKLGGNSNNLFTINRTTGEIIVIGDLDRETTATHNLIIKATNNATYVASGTYNVMTDTTLKEVQIVVKDINDNAPVFDNKIYTSSKKDFVLRFFSLSANC